MKRIITVFLILFLSLIYTTSSLKTFEVDETEKVSLGLDVEDPDAEDTLTYMFTEPLDGNGEWQTTYGDEGRYNVTVSVSDGETLVSEKVTIIVHRKEAEPIIDSFSPSVNFIKIEEGNDVEFKVMASDPNNDELSFQWLVNDEIVSESDEMIFSATYQDSGSYTIILAVTDDVFEVFQEWAMKVEDVDLNAVMESIEDVVILEKETVELELPNFEEFGLTYTISEPLGDNNEWETGYKDAGNYSVIVKASGNGFDGETVVKIIIENNDRAPKLSELKKFMTISENEELTIEFNAVDPDDDLISLFVEDMPDGATFDGKIFSWTPGFGFVRKDSTFDYVLEKFRLLGGSVNVAFVAKSNDLIDKKNVRIRVKNVNRPFVLNEIEDIEVDEGEEIFIDPKYSDPDDETVKFSYSGFMNRASKQTSFEDAGEYIVKVTATDDFFTQTRLVKVIVNDVNRKPVFNSIGNVQVKEGSELRLELKGSDPDNDAVSFSADELPGGAVLKDNLFVWKPDFDVVNETQKEFNVKFTISDGDEEVSQEVKITILDVNQAPEIISSSDNLIVIKDTPVLFEVNARDVDGDELTYTWNFGTFSKFEGENQHQRIFVTDGNKKVKVTVSDGMHSVSKVWDVLVV